jgi:DNA adenine methylase
MSNEPRPFLRWAGSKNSLLSKIVPVLPPRFGSYFEPFLGGGALFFLLQPRRAVLGDTCAELIETFRAVRDDVSSVARFLSPLRPRKDEYYRIRDNRSSTRLKRAAEFIFLNKSCWNGLYRVNSHGEFNVPFGRPKTDFIVERTNLISCSQALRRRGVRLRVADFEAQLDDARPGDLVYLDPPYVTRHNNNGFVEWNQRLFSWADQERLARAAARLKKRGVNVIVSNANHRDILRLYPTFHSVEVSRRSTLASDKSKRGPVTEILLWSR